MYDFFHKQFKSVMAVNLYEKNLFAIFIIVNFNHSFSTFLKITTMI